MPFWYRDQVFWHRDHRFWNCPEIGHDRPESVVTMGQNTQLYLLATSYAKNYRLTLRLCHISQLRTNFSIHKSVHKRAGIAIRYANTFTICLRIAELVGLVVIVHVVQLLLTWLTKELALGCYKALPDTPTSALHNAT